VKIFIQNPSRYFCCYVESRKQEDPEAEIEITRFDNEEKKRIKRKLETM